MTYFHDIMNTRRNFLSFFLIFKKLSGVTLFQRKSFKGFKETEVSRAKNEFPS